MTSPRPWPVGVPLHRTPPPDPAAAASAVNLTKVYGQPDAQVVALDSVSVAFRRGEFAAIMGPSGSGKSTLMHCLAGLDSGTSGGAWLGDVELSRLGDRALTRLRRERIGFVFQAFHLIPALTVLENIVLPLTVAGRRPDQQWLRWVIDTVGLAHRLGHRPAQLSGGQQQRVACARALVGRPEIVFADEPTGNLDSRAAADILGFLRRCVRELGRTVVMVTHDPLAASHSDRIVFLSDGRIVDELARPTPDLVMSRMRQFDTSIGIGHWAGPDAGP